VLSFHIRGQETIAFQVGESSFQVGEASFQVEEASFQVEEACPSWDGEAHRASFVFDLEVFRALGVILAFVIILRSQIEDIHLDGFHELKDLEFCFFVLTSFGVQLDSSDC